MVESIFHQIKQTYPSLGDHIEYLKLKSPLNSFVKDDGTTVPSSLGVLKGILEQRRKSCECGGILVFNPAALWQCAYGELRKWEEALPEILRVVGEARFDRVFFVTSTAVHPVVYNGLASDQKKWAMTDPRVQALNTAAVQEIMQLAREQEQDPELVSIGVIDIWPLSSLREDDPANPTDMRHYGSSTMASVVDVILTHICR
jgi:hypothetical protein